MSDEKTIEEPEGSPNSFASAEQEPKSAVKELWPLNDSPRTEDAQHLVSVSGKVHFKPTLADMQLPLCESINREELEPELDTADLNYPSVQPSENDTPQIKDISLPYSVIPSELKPNVDSVEFIGQSIQEIENDLFAIQSLLCETINHKDFNTVADSIDFKGQDVSPVENETPQNEDLVSQLSLCMQTNREDLPTDTHSLGSAAQNEQAKDNVFIKKMLQNENIPGCSTKCAHKVRFSPIVVEIPIPPLDAEDFEELELDVDSASCTSECESESLSESESESECESVIEQLPLSKASECEVVDLNYGKNISKKVHFSSVLIDIPTYSLNSAEQENLKFDMDSVGCLSENMNANEHAPLNEIAEGNNASLKCTLKKNRKVHFSPIIVNIPTDSFPLEDDTDEFDSYEDILDSNMENNTVKELISASKTQQSKPGILKHQTKVSREVHFGPSFSLDNSSVSVAAANKNDKVKFTISCPVSIRLLNEVELMNINIF